MQHVRLLAQSGLDLAASCIASSAVSDERREIDPATSIPRRAWPACLRPAGPRVRTPGRPLLRTAAGCPALIAIHRAPQGRRARGRSPLRFSGRSRSAPLTMAGGGCGSTELRPSSTIDQGSPLPPVRHRPQVVRCRIGDQRLPHSLPGGRGAVWPSAGPSTVVRPAMNGPVISAPPVHRTSCGRSWSDSPRSTCRRTRVVERFDRGAVPVRVNIAEHRFRSVVRSGCAGALSSPPTRNRPGSTTPGRFRW